MTSARSLTPASSSSTFLGLPLGAGEGTLRSELDASVNFTRALGAGEGFEARYVRRGPDYIVCYLSAQSACAQACRFCHLTASGQVRGRDASVEELLAQAREVLEHYRTQVESGQEAPAGVVHFNFMARGEPLASQVVLNHSAELFSRLHALAGDAGLTPVIKISTIGARGEQAEREWLEIFPGIQPDLYYSLYSMDPQFRARWLPRALDPEHVLGRLARWQRVVRHIPVIHHALISGANSAPEHTEAIIEAVEAHQLRVDVNLVAYNPPGTKTGTEALPEEIEATLALYKTAWPSASVRHIPRVGADVAASCGMFLGGRAPR